MINFWSIYNYCKLINAEVCVLYIRHDQNDSGCVNDIACYSLKSFQSTFAIQRFQQVYWKLPPLNCSLFGVSRQTSNA
jgi:hypothetical protein